MQPGGLIGSFVGKLLPLRDTDPGTADARAQERYRRAAVTGITSAAARAVQIGTSLVTVPLTIHYLGNERFGLWMTISSVLAIMRFADFGLGNGVLNAVSDADGKEDLNAIRSAISSGFCLLTCVAVLLFLTFLAFYRIVHWDDVFKVHTALARAEAGPAFLVFAACFALNMPLDIVQRVQLGLQQGFNSNLWQLVGSILGFVGVLIAIHFKVSLQLLLLALAGAPVFATLLNGIAFFGFYRPDLRPGLSHVNKSAVRRIAHLGSLFFFLQAAVALAYSSDNFILARLFGAAAVSDYAVPQRMFALISMMIAMFALPLWPAYGEAMSRGDIAWVRHTLKHSLLIVFTISSTGALALFLVAKKLILLWVGPNLHPSTALLLGLAVWTILDCCGNVLSMFLNGISFMRFQVIVASTFAVGCLALKIVLAGHYGLPGIPWAAVISYSLLNAIPCAMVIPRFIRNIKHPESGGPLAPASPTGPSVESRMLR